jgi:hypothetical protein
MGSDETAAESHAAAGGGLVDDMDVLGRAAAVFRVLPGFKGP